MRGVGFLGAILIAAAVVGAGCGGSSSVGVGGLVSCTIAESIGGDAGVSLKICEEVTGSPQAAQQIRQSCMASGAGTGLLADAGLQVGATFQNGPCSRVGALGGCEVTQSGVTETGWYYDDGTGLQTSADIQTLCATAGATFVPPS
jgi:hypothetical protein